MTAGILSALGGLGVFLLGMVVMTDGLKAITGNALRQALARFTKSPTSGAVTGAIATAIIQSSSATTVTAVGFVGARLITFSQALGIIFGANIGTTITGWLVAIVGFKLKIGMLALPFVLVGVLMHLFLRRHWAALGLALAGFGLIFVGIDLIQQGMAGLQGIITPDSFPGDHLGGRLLLVLIGITITLITQSSSAGVATALTAVHAGAISFEQAAVMVIGMNVGTTATAALATIGGSTDVRRTGYAHVIYNILTGIGAFLLVTPYTWACSSIFPVGFEENPEIALVGFHTLFNTLGVIVVLPLTGAFARLMIWLVPESPVKYTQRLDRSLYESPVVAIDAVKATLKEITQVVLQRLFIILETGPSAATETTLSDADVALKKTRDYVTPIATSNVHPELYPRKLSAIHTIDHLRRLIDRCQQFKRSQRTREPELAALREMLLDAVRQALSDLANGAELSDTNKEEIATTARLKQVWQEFEVHAEQYRHSLIASAAGGAADAYSTIGKLDALRWIRRVSYHVWRIMHHLSSEADDNEIGSAEMPVAEADNDRPND
jgi:phosphate:Na+ symporter